MRLNSMCAYRKILQKKMLLLQEAFRNEVLGVLMIKRWHKMFQDSRESTVFEPQGGKPKTVCTMTNMNIVRTTIENDCYQLAQGFATELKLSWESIRRILISELGMKRMCSA